MHILDTLIHARTSNLEDRLETFSNLTFITWAYNKVMKAKSLPPCPIKSPSANQPDHKKLKSLADLKQVKKVLAQKAQENARQALLLKKRKQQAASDQNLFRAAIGQVAPLKDKGYAFLQQNRPQPLPLQREQDEKRVLQESISDEFDVETLLDTDETLSYRREGIGPDVVRKLRRGHWSLQGQIDLHGLTRDEARTALGEFLREALRKGLRCIRVVHGKGLGSPGKTPILKNHMLRWLAQKDEVLAYTQARAAEGGAGAVIVLLRNSPR